MCFAPEADFTAAVAVGAVGVASLRQVRDRREVIVAALPVLFAAHQFVEGFVWLGLRGEIASGVGDAARDVYLLFAFAVLPVLVPLGFLLLEPGRRRRRWLAPFVALGAAVGLFLLWHVTQYPILATEHARGIAYYTHVPGDAVAVLYLVATCGPPLLSTRPYLRWFGVINLVGAGFAAVVSILEFESLWCLYAALASVLILEHFRRERAAEGGQSGRAIRNSSSTTA
jgi:hypothetical protein